MVVTSVAVHEEREEIDGVKVRDRGLEPRGKTPRQTHQPISSVVDVPGEAPPPGNDQFGTAFGAQGLEVGDGRVVGVAAERVLLAVAAAEGPVAQCFQGDDATYAPPGQGHVVHREITGLRFQDENVGR